ncbi:toxic anion resistance protein [Actinoallomurus rhizosphaericola]|uniref:toxic anion resistance protein n=1 Tax=Actinoallomurus rhizosphaericola TaxID=2952536 RepID=UPI002092063C|nr:toxic anion resistance protein [Actinoallomurus rhizosphaericola]MCO5999015.1 toxic anion resistance protein [Actinoallomurus rhizosphaericola]
MAAEDLILTPPEPVAAVPADRAETLIPMEDAQRDELTRRARTYVDDLASLDPRSPEFMSRIGQVAALGDGEIRASAQAANRMLGRSVAALSGAKGESADAQQRVAKGLVELRRTVEDLDPKDVGRVTGRRLLSKLPFGRSLRDFVSRYQSANVNINKIVTALRSGQDELRRDNAAIQNERAALWATMGKLQEYAVLAQALDEAVERLITETADEEKANALRADVLFPVRQKRQDLLTQLAVCAQGYLALDTVRRNNDELVRGVDRAASTTVSALRIAVTIAAALSNQKLVIEQVNALRATTEDIIRTNAELLAGQSGEIQRIAADPAVGVQTLRASFEQIYRTIDAVDAFKAQAVTNMQATVDALGTELNRASAYLSRAHERNELES